MTPERKQELFRESEWFDSEPVMALMERMYDNLDGSGDIALLTEIIYVMARTIERLQREIHRNESVIDSLINSP